VEAEANPLANSALLIVIFGLVSLALMFNIIALPFLVKLYRSYPILWTWVFAMPKGNFAPGIMNALLTEAEKIA
jgi:hypothetical protein